MKEVAIFETLVVIVVDVAVDDACAAGGVKGLQLPLFPLTNPPALNHTNSEAQTTIMDRFILDRNDENLLDSCLIRAKILPRMLLRNTSNGNDDTANTLPSFCCFRRRALLLLPS